MRRRFDADLSSGETEGTSGSTQVVKLCYSLGIPADCPTTAEGGSLTFDTDTGSITLPGDMLAGISGSEGKKAEITIGQGDKSGLPDDV